MVTIAPPTRSSYEVDRYVVDYNSTNDSHTDIVYLDNVTKRDNHSVLLRNVVPGWPYNVIVHSVVRDVFSEPQTTSCAAGKHEPNSIV
jgi:hypothetical protein